MSFTVQHSISLSVLAGGEYERNPWGADALKARQSRKAAVAAHCIKVAANFIEDPENFDPTKFEDKVSAEER